MSKLYKILAEILEEDISNINDNSSPETLTNWDSFNGLLLVDKLEKEYGVKFNLEEITDVKNVADIKKHLKNHKVSPEDI